LLGEGVGEVGEGGARVEEDGEGEVGAADGGGAELEVGEGDAEFAVDAMGGYDGEELDRAAVLGGDDATEEDVA
jgi:hypothetical protein